MRTALTTFSRDFSRSVRPLLDPFDGAVREIESVPDEALRGEVLSDLKTVRDQMGVLLEKVESQQTYVMIFGPLKSGKSTLMNALAGSYVSEVTSLPAYPAVVFVSHADAPSYRVTRYDGTSEDLEDSDALYALVDDAHVELAAAIRQAELEERDFDPERDLPYTIKRIDVKLPAGDLAASDTVMVDTPGLYTRMKFGYDQMTRDFRHAASIAIFVVRSDNIFLEQVFEEFTELLDLFSKVFLVLNFDSTKVDVDAQGELVPSLEQTDPERIVRAFEDYSMNARLKLAEQEGRLRIVPIDLLRAAAGRLKGSAGGAAEGEAAQAASRFLGFRDELADFLDSNDHLTRFVTDGLTRASILIDRLEGVAGHPEVRQFMRRLEGTVAERDEERRTLDAVRACQAHDWTASLTQERKSATGKAKEQRRLVGDALRSQTERALSAWFDDDSSLRDLVEDEILPKCDRVRDQLRTFAFDDLRRRIDDGLPGLDLDDEVRAALGRLRIDLAAIGREALAEVAARPIRKTRLDWPVAAEDVPVKKSFWDWILFRGRDTVRERLLGPDDDPSEEIPAVRKAKYLGEPARAAIAESFDEEREALLDATFRLLDRDVAVVFAERFTAHLTRILDARAAEHEPRVEALVRDVEARRGVPVCLDRLRSALRDTRRELQAVKDSHTPKLDGIEAVELPEHAHEETEVQLGESEEEPTGQLGEEIEGTFELTPEQLVAFEAETAAKLAGSAESSAASADVDDDAYDASADADEPVKVLDVAPRPVAAERPERDEAEPEPVARRDDAS